MQTIVKFDPLSPASECQLLDMKSGLSSYGLMLDIHKGAIRFAIGNEPLARHPHLVRFLDPVSQESICLFIRVKGSFRLFGFSDFLMCQRIKSSKRNFLARADTRKPRIYTTRILSKKQLPAAYKKLYERAISDKYMDSMSKDRRSPFSTLLRLFIKEKFRFKIAQTDEEKESAYRLVHKEYVHRGFIPDKEDGVYTSLHQLLPGTTTFIGYTQQKDVLLTLTSVMDSPLKLPSDRLFSDVFDQMRHEGRRLIEFTMLSTKRNAFGKKAYSLFHYQKMATLFSLFRLAFRHAWEVEKATDIVMSIHPRFQKLYEYIQFEKLTDVRHYKEFKNNPAIAFRLNLQKFTDPKVMSGIERSILFKYFTQSKIASDILEAKGSHSPEQLERLFKNLIISLPPVQRQAICTAYPDLRGSLNE